MSVSASAAMAPTRSRNRTHNRNPSTWTAADDEILAKLVETTDDWTEIAKSFPDRTSKQVLAHWKKVANPAIVRGSWTGQEDQLIIQWVTINGPQRWTALAEGMSGRIAKQCRERWWNHLDPNVKRSGWTPQEDQAICEAIRRIGPKWADIARILPGRTDNSVKNRWNSTLRRRLSGDENATERKVNTLEENRMLLGKMLQLNGTN